MIKVVRHTPPRTKITVRWRKVGDLATAAVSNVYFPLAG